MRSAAPGPARSTGTVGGLGEAGKICVFSHLRTGPSAQHLADPVRRVQPPHREYAEEAVLCMHVVTLTAKRQATLPAALCKELGLAPGAKVTVERRLIGKETVWVLKGPGPDGPVGLGRSHRLASSGGDREGPGHGLNSMVLRLLIGEPRSQTEVARRRIERALIAGEKVVVIRALGATPVTFDRR